MALSIRGLGFSLQVLYLRIKWQSWETHNEISEIDASYFPLKSKHLFLLECWIFFSVTSSDTRKSIIIMFLSHLVLKLNKQPGRFASNALPSSVPVDDICSAENDYFSFLFVPLCICPWFHGAERCNRS